MYSRDITSTHVDEMDFEDKLALFEEKLRGHGGKMSTPHSDSDGEMRVGTEQAPLSPTELETELRGLLQEFVSCIPRLQNMAVSYDEASDADFDSNWLKSEVGREVFKTEIRTTVCELRKWQSDRGIGAEQYSSVQNATLRSLKRVVADREEEIDELRRKCSAMEKERCEAVENVERLTSSAYSCTLIHTPMKDEVRRLREENEAQQKCIRENAEVSKRSLAERARFQSTIARYREELQLANHQVETAELDAKHAKEECESMKKRVKESNASSMAVSSRVKELQEVQDAMLRIMQAPAVRTDRQRLRRNLEDLNERRTRLVGKIASLLTRKRRGEAGDSGPSSPRSVNVQATGSRVEERKRSSRDGGDGESAFEPASSFAENFGENAASPGSSMSSRKFFGSLRKFGSELVKKRSGPDANEPAWNETPRQQRQSVLENVERSRAAIENDVALRGVIQMKENEIHRMERELNDARERTAKLEKSLQRERHKRRLENRSLNKSGEEEVCAETSSRVFTHRKSLFGWQSGENKPGSDVIPEIGSKETSSEAGSGHVRKPNFGGA